MTLYYWSVALNYVYSPVKLSEIQIMNEECKMYLLKVTITWDIPLDAVPGNYRIVHLGHYKHILRGITPYQGSSRIFRVGSEIKQNQGNF